MRPGIATSNYVFGNIRLRKWNCRGMLTPKQNGPILGPLLPYRRSTKGCTGAKIDREFKSNNSCYLSWIRTRPWKMGTKCSIFLLNNSNAKIETENNTGEGTNISRSTCRQLI